MKTIIPLILALILLCGCVTQETTTTSSSTTTTAPTTTTSLTTTSTTTKATTTTSTTTTTTTSTLPGTVVRIHEFMFDPNPVIISRGGIVTWVNDDSARHQIVGVGYESGDLLKGGTYSRTYTRIGSFPYHCRYHPQMRGEVRVV